MRRFLVSVSYWMTLLFSLGECQLFANSSCICTLDRCKHSNSTCDLNPSNSCYRLFIQVDQEDKTDTRGCIARPLEKDFDYAYSLTIAIIDHDRTYVAISRCANDNCNSGDNPAGRWANVGVDGSCTFPPEVERIVVYWAQNGTVLNDIRDWCADCNGSSIMQPVANESLCKWFNVVSNETAEPSTTAVPATPSKPHLYVSASVAALILLLGAGLGIVEFVKVHKAKTAKATAPKKKGARERVMMTTLLPPTKMKQVTKPEAGVVRQRFRRAQGSGGSFGAGGRFRVVRRPFRCRVCCHTQ